MNHFSFSRNITTMKFFRHLDYPKFNLLDDLTYMTENDIISFGYEDDNQPMTRQICINTIEDEPDNYRLGNGSLYYDWDRSYFDNELKTTVVPPRDRILEETDFNTICSQFKNTEFEKLYDFLNERYILGRVRVMQSDPKSVLTWHTDTSPRIHYVLQTDVGCKMVIEDEVLHLPENTWWFTETTNHHTAFNGSKIKRIHVVAGILGER